MDLENKRRKVERGRHHNRQKGGSRTHITTLIPLIKHAVKATLCSTIELRCLKSILGTYGGSWSIKEGLRDT